MMHNTLKKLFAAVMVGAVLSACGGGPEGSLPDSGQNLEGDEKTVFQICTSKAPVLILDHFNTESPDYGVRASDKVIDIDGDLSPDVGHGDIVKRVASFSQRDIKTYGISENHFYMSADMIADRFADIAAKIESGEIEKPSAVIFSVSFPFSFKAINALLEEDLGLTPGNVFDKQPEIISKLVEKYASKPNEYVRMAYRLYEGISKLKSMGVPVVTGAGNNFSETTVNLAALVGAVPVGALTKEGNVHPVSNENSLTSVYRIGEFFSRRTQDGGIDLNNDGKADFSAESLSNNKELLSLFYTNGVYDNKTKFPVTFGTSLSAPGICNK